MSKRKWYDFEGRLSRRAGGYLGRGLGSLIPVTGASEVGEFLGNAVGGFFHKVTGIGDYSESALIGRIKRNTLLGIDPHGGIGAQFGDGYNDIVITRREYVDDVLSSVDFQNTTYKLQPSDPTTYPWASRIAPLFNQWEPLGEIWEFVSLSADALDSKDTALGTIAMTCEYNPSDIPFQSMREVLNNNWTVFTKPSCSLRLPIECSMSERPINPFFIRNAGGTPPDGLKFYDLGNVQIATEGMQQGGVIIGRLFHSYMLRFKKPQLPTFTPGAGPAMGVRADNPTSSNIFATNASTGADFNHDLAGATFQGGSTGIGWVSLPSSVSGTFMLSLNIQTVGNTYLGAVGITASNGVDVSTLAELNVQGPGNTGVTMSTNHPYWWFMTIDATVPINKVVYLAPGANFNGANIGTDSATTYAYFVQVPDFVKDLVTVG